MEKWNDFVPRKDKDLSRGTFRNVSKVLPASVGLHFSSNTSLHTTTLPLLKLALVDDPAEFNTVFAVAANAVLSVSKLVVFRAVLTVRFMVARGPRDHL